MKQVAHFIGKVSKLDNSAEIAYAVIKEMPDGRSISTTANSELFIKNGIREGDDFEIIINKSDDGTLSPTIQKSEESQNFDI